MYGGGQSLSFISYSSFLFITKPDASLSQMKYPLS